MKIIIIVFCFVFIRCVSDEREACYRDKEVRSKTSQCEFAFFALSKTGQNQYSDFFYNYMLIECLTGHLNRIECNKKSPLKPAYNPNTGGG